MSVEFAYVVETQKSFDDTVVSVLKSVEAKGWSLFGVYDVKERLAAKGFVHEQLKIIEICSGKHANKLLKMNRLVSLCMPCKINIFSENGIVKIVGMNPSIMHQFFPEISKEEVNEVEKEIKEIIDNSK